jgi:MFS family permease
LSSSIRKTTIFVKQVEVIRDLVDTTSGTYSSAKDSKGLESRFFGVSKMTWLVFTISTINSFGFSATMPFLGVYLLDVRDVPLGEIGIVYLATGVLGIASLILSGRITDSLGPKKVMLLGFMSSLASSLFLGYMVFSNANVLAFFFLYPVFSMFRGISQPAISAIVASQKRTEVRTGFSFLNIGGNLGFAIGPALAGVIIQATNYSTVFLLSAGSSVVATLITLIWVEGGKLQGGSSRSVAINRWLKWSMDRSLILLLLLVFCMYLCIGYEITPMSLYVANIFSFSDAQLGYLFATNGLLIVIFQLPITRMIGKSRRILLPLVISSGFALASFLIAGFSQTFLQWEIFMVVITFGEITLTVPSQSVIAFFSRVGNRGTYQGYYSAVSNAGMSIASFVGPLSFSIFAFDPRFSWFSIAGLALATGLGLLALSPAIQTEYEATLATPE